MQVTVRLKDGAPKLKRLVLLADLSITSSMTIHSNSLANNYRALLERVVYHKGVRPIQATSRFDLLAKRRIQKFECQIPRISSAEFVEHYVGRKRLIYENAARSLVLRPIEHRDFKVKSFVKSNEKFDLSKKSEKCPRLI